VNLVTRRLYGDAGDADRRVGVDRDCLAGCVDLLVYSTFLGGSSEKSTPGRPADAAAASDDTMSFIAPLSRCRGAAICADSTAA
jgi:hypothetical protein